MARVESEIPENAHAGKGIEPPPALGMIRQIS